MPKPFVSLARGIDLQPQDGRQERTSGDKLTKYINFRDNVRRECVCSNWRHLANDEAAGATGRHSHAYKVGSTDPTTLSRWKKKMARSKRFELLTLRFVV